MFVSLPPFFPPIKTHLMVLMTVARGRFLLMVSYCDYFFTYEWPGRLCSFLLEPPTTAPEDTFPGAALRDVIAPRRQDSKQFSGGANPPPSHQGSSPTPAKT